MVAVCVVCSFWIFTAWPSGAIAALIVGLACALFGSRPNPDVAIGQFFLGSLAGIGAGSDRSLLIRGAFTPECATPSH